MKLKELLQTIFENDISKEYQLKPEDLKLIKNQLLQCDEFKNVDELIIMDAPNGEFKNKDNSTFNVHAFVHKFMKDTKYKGTCYLYYIGLSPGIYNRPLDQVKNNIGFIPSLINPHTFESEKIITISVPVDSNKEQIKTILLNLVDDLDNLKEYTLPQGRNIVIRGLFLEEGHEPNSKEMVTEDNKCIIKDVYRPEAEVIILNN